LVKPRFIVSRGAGVIKILKFRSKEYREFVSGLPCCVSGVDGVANDPHHIKGRGFGGSSKCSDLFCIPLSHQLHQEFHQIGWKSFESKHNIDQLIVVFNTIEQALTEGVICES